MTILQALKGYYDRVAEREPGTPRFGYGFAPISFSLVLRNDGILIDVDDLREQGEKKLVPKTLLVPKDFDDRTSGNTPRVFWDKTEYVLGVPFDNERTTLRHSNFCDRHKELFAGTTDDGLLAVLAFLKSWHPNRFAALRHAKDIIPESNFVFRLDGEQQFIHERPAARELWERDLARLTGGAIQCLVSGSLGTLARIHPLIKNIAQPGQPTPKFVAFDKGSDAFASFGKEQGANAATSQCAAFAYATALNELLARSRGRDKKGRPLYRNRIQLADATTVFWAAASEAAEAEAAEDFFSYASAPPDDEAETTKMRPAMQALAEGRPLDLPDMHLTEDTKFYILGLSPNAARISVRFWHQTTLGDLGRRFHQHWRDLRIDGVRWKQPPAIWWLLTRMGPARRNEQGQVKYDTKHIPPNLAGEVMRAILSGTPYPRTLLANLLMRLRTDRVADGLRIALIKACLVREMRLRNPDLPKEKYVSLNRDDTDPAYRLGRLFAVLERSQEAALDGINATIRDRFYGSASATPAAVFPILIRNGMHHLAGLRKGRGARWVKKPAATGHWLGQEMGEILNGLDRDWPKSFTMEAQGRFAMGYFHQKYAKREDAPDDLKTSPEIDDTPAATEEETQ